MWKHFNTSLGAEVLEAGLEPHSNVEFDENYKGKLYTQKCYQQVWEPLERPEEFEKYTPFIGTGKANLIEILFIRIALPGTSLGPVDVCEQAAQGPGFQLCFVLG